VGKFRLVWTLQEGGDTHRRSFGNPKEGGTMTDYDNAMAIADELKSTVRELAKLNEVLREIKGLLEEMIEVGEDVEA